MRQHQPESEVTMKTSHLSLPRLFTLGSIITLVILISAFFSPCAHAGGFASGSSSVLLVVHESVFGGLVGELEQFETDLAREGIAARIRTFSSGDHLTVKERSIIFSQ
jgi:hypothetical protein